VLYLKIVELLRKVELYMSKIMKIAGAVAIINILARLLGFIREIAITNQYGASTTADTIAKAYTIPNFTSFRG
jgi:putative peptidoglycan lipid II flippase